MSVDGRGVACIKLGNDTFHVPNSLWVKGLRNGLISVGQATSIGLSFWFDGDTCHIFNEDKKLLMVVDKVDNLYPVPTDPIASNHASVPS